jgi:hypothetical protein
LKSDISRAEIKIANQMLTNSKFYSKLFLALIRKIWKLLQYHPTKNNNNQQQV